MLDSRQREHLRSHGLTEADLEGHDLDVIVRNAASLALHAHRDHRGKAGEPYIGHPLRVAKHMGDDRIAQAVALLHDTVEDTWVTMDMIRDRFPTCVADGVDAMTKRTWIDAEGNTSKEPLETYLRRVWDNPIARKVKIDGDMVDNTDPNRRPRLPDAERTRLDQKYAGYHRLFAKFAAQDAARARRTGSALDRDLIGQVHKFTAGGQASPTAAAARARREPSSRADHSRPPRSAPGSPHFDHRVGGWVPAPE